MEKEDEGGERGLGEGGGVEAERAIVFYLSHEELVFSSVRSGVVLFEKTLLDLHCQNVCPV